MQVLLHGYKRAERRLPNDVTRGTRKTDADFLYDTLSLHKICVLIKTKKKSQNDGVMLHFSRYHKQLQQCVSHMSSDFPASEWKDLDIQNEEDLKRKLRTYVKENIHLHAHSVLHLYMSGTFLSGCSAEGRENATEKREAGSVLREQWDR